MLRSILQGQIRPQGGAAALPIKSLPQRASLDFLPGLQIITVCSSVFSNQQFNQNTMLLKVHFNTVSTAVHCHI